MDKFTTDRDNAIQWARKLFEHGEFVILDTETTGLDSSAEIMQFAFVNHNDTNSIQFDVCPTKDATLDEGAFRTHGITLESVATAPPITIWADNITDIVKGKTVIAWNASFDYRMLIQSFGAWGVEPPAIIHLANFECAMLQHAKYVGDWDARRGQYRWQKLPGATHGALADCRAVLNVLREMAAARLSTDDTLIEVNTTVDYNTETITQKLTFAPEPISLPVDAFYESIRDNLIAVGVIVTIEDVNGWRDKQRIQALNWSYERRFKNRDAERPAFLPEPTGPIASPSIDDMPEPVATPEPETTSTAVEVDFGAADYLLSSLLETAGMFVRHEIPSWTTAQRIEAANWAADVAVADISELLGQPFTTPTRPAFITDSPEIDIPF